MKHTFGGGTHVKEYKYTSNREIVVMPAPDTLSVLLSQHIGTPAKPTVAVGDYVRMGQMIADVQSGLGCPVHSPVSGKIAAFGSMEISPGRQVEFIKIENDGKYEKDSSVTPFGKNPEEADAAEIIEVIRRAGISGNGGATFPTYAKIQSAIGKADTVIINGSECEPFLTSDHRLMYELPEKVIGGAKILLHAVGAPKGVIAIEDNKPDAITSMSIAAAGSRFEVASLATKYPQGDERQLVYAITEREIPTGKLPADAGCVIFNVGTCVAVYDAFYGGMPMISRVVTVAGDCVRHPSNVLAYIGSSYRDIIEFCGGLTEIPKKLICGGPMMGTTVSSFDRPLTKGNSGILLFSKRFAGSLGGDESPCIRCGRCLSVCPMRLMTGSIVSSVKRGLFGDAENLGIMSCVECGACAYNCPARIPLVQYMRAGKSYIRSHKTTGGSNSTK